MQLAEVFAKAVLTEIVPQKPKSITYIQSATHSHTPPNANRQTLKSE